MCGGGGFGNVQHEDVCADEQVVDEGSEDREPAYGAYDQPCSVYYDWESKGRKGGCKDVEV